MLSLNRTKRIIDLSVTFMLSPIWLPLTLIGSLIVLIVSPGNPFYASRRVGRYNNTVIIYKIRTMVKNADKMGSGITALNDQRLIPLGRLLRLTKIDELPQFWSVLKGDLAIVGPRPELPQFVAHYSDREREIILSVKPGIVDYGTLAFPDIQSILGHNPSEEDFLKHLAKEKIKYRLKYVEEQSLWTDLKILATTPISLIRELLRIG